MCVYPLLGVYTLVVVVSVYILWADSTILVNREERMPRVTMRPQRAKKLDRNRPRWAINPGPFQKALEELGITLPVKVRRTFHRTQYGHCQPKWDDSGVPYFCITARKTLTRESAVKVLLHELRHAWQYENECYNKNLPVSEVVKVWNSRIGKEAGPYWDRAYEVDAREAEKRYKEFLDIVVELP